MAELDADWYPFVSPQAETTSWLFRTKVNLRHYYC